MGESNGEYPNLSPTVHGFDEIPPSKRPRHDAVIFDAFPLAEDNNDAAGMTDLTQIFSLEWASPPASAAPLPTTDRNASPVSDLGRDEFTHPIESRSVLYIQADSNLPVAVSEVPRRFSQQLAEYALESGMFDRESFELFTEDAFLGMTVNVNAGGGIGSTMHPAAPPSGAMSVSPAQTESRTPVPQFAAPIQT